VFRHGRLDPAGFHRHALRLVRRRDRRVGVAGGRISFVARHDRFAVDSRPRRHSIGINRIGIWRIEPAADRRDPQFDISTFSRRKSVLSSFGHAEPIDPAGGRGEPTVPRRERWKRTLVQRDRNFDDFGNLLNRTM
jgi:hypothetical protein